MKLPDNWKSYRSLVLGKVNNLCKSGLWHIDFDQVKLWMSNFTTDEEKYLSAHILDSIIYRSNDMAVSAFSRHIMSDLKILLENTGSIKPTTLRDWKSYLKRPSESNILFSCVRKKEDEGESGSHIIRKLTSQILSDKVIISRDDIPQKTLKALILVDDFIGSGRQFLDYAKEIQLEEILNRASVIYMPLIACSEGIQEISKIYPSLTVTPTETIDKSFNFFSDKSSLSLDKNNKTEDFQKTYMSLEEKFSLPKDDWMGYNKCSLTITFEWGCPNQTIPLIWVDTLNNNEDCHQLFKRRN